MLTFIGGAAIFPLSILVLFLRKKADVLAGFILLPPIISGQDCIMPVRAR